jgi:hypothetical protein
MKRAPFFVVTLAIAALAQQPSTASAPAESQVVGTWVAVHRSLGGLGSIWEFMPGGTLRMSVGAIVEEPYRLDGHQLLLPSGSTRPDAKPMITNIRFEGDYMFQSSPEVAPQREARFKRVSPVQPGDPPIVGVWELDKPASAATVTAGSGPEAASGNAALAEIAHNTFHEYTRDGLAKIRVPMRSTSGSYDLAAQTFTVLPPASDSRTLARTGNFRLHDGLLVLTQPDGKSEDVYVRADATADELKRAGVSYGGKAADFSPARLEKQPR